MGCAPIRYKRMMTFNHNYIWSELHSSDEAAADFQSQRESFHGSKQNKIRRNLNGINDQRTQQILWGRNSEKLNQLLVVFERQHYMKTGWPNLGGIHCALFKTIQEHHILIKVCVCFCTSKMNPISSPRGFVRLTRWCDLVSYRRAEW